MASMLRINLPPWGGWEKAIRKLECGGKKFRHNCGGSTGGERRLNKKTLHWGWGGGREKRRNNKGKERRFQGPKGLKKCFPLGLEGAFPIMKLQNREKRKAILFKARRQKRTREGIAIPQRGLATWGSHK